MINSKVLRIKESSCNEMDHESNPKLVISSGRNKEECESLLKTMQYKDKIAINERLCHDLSGFDYTEHNYKGFLVLGKDFIKIKECPLNTEKIPIWYVFSGMGSQWPGMGRDLMKIKAFKESIHQSAEVLKPVGVNLIDLIFNSTEQIFDSVINRFVMIVSTQVALIDLFKAIGIQADGIVGISTGELSCAYADGSLTLEQTVLSAFWRGKCVEEYNSIPGAMATVALSAEKIHELCPSDIQLAGIVAHDYVSISGPKESVDKFVESLKNKAIFAKTVDTAGVAFHSKYITEAGSRLKIEMAKFIPSPKERSSKWISTAVSEDCWEDPIAKLSSPDYFVNNLLQPFYFFEALKHIQANAIIIEVSLDNRHWTLRTVLKRYLPETTTIIGLHKFNQSDHMAKLLSAVGKLYVAGAKPDVEKLCLVD